MLSVDTYMSNFLTCVSLSFAFPMKISVANTSAIEVLAFYTKLCCCHKVPSSHRIRGYDDDIKSAAGKTFSK